MNIKTTLAIAALLAAALPAHADDAPRMDAARPAARNAANLHREQARAANEQAAEQAVAAVLETTRLDLDIKLIGPTSKKIARDR